MKPPKKSQPASSERKLAAILFADIVGYTALMQKDEDTANILLEKFHNNLNTKVTHHNGQVINNYGDGCVCTFDSAVAAMKCAKEVQAIFQTELKVPVRIGLHSGDVMFKENNVYGDSVNIASRIESLGVAGAVLFSKRIKRDITNQTDFKIQSLGEFDFKNIDKTMEVFALANEGFAIPKRTEMKGKLKSNSNEENNFFQRIWKKKIPQILAVYILIAWLGLQLFDWALNQFGISPHWAQIFFISVIGVIPSLLVYLNNRERIHSKHLKIGEKILFPSNLVLVGTALFFMFSGSELGAISQNITFINADGVEETKSIVKEEFRQRLPIFPFESIQEDSANAWLEMTIPLSLQLDLEQDKYLDPSTELWLAGASDNTYTTTDKVNTSKLLSTDFYIDGTFKVKGKEFEITSVVRNKTNGKVQNQKTFKGIDYASLIDSTSVFLRQSIGLSPSQINESVDLNFGDYTSNNMEALYHLALGGGGSTNYREIEKAIELDSTMALSYFRHATMSYYRSRGEMEIKYMIDKAMKYRKKLPFQYQIAIMAYHHMIYKEWEKAEQLIKIQLEMSPNDPQINELLLEVYWLNGEIDKLTNHLEKRFAENPNPSNGFQAMKAFLMKGEPDKVISRVKTFLMMDQQNIYALDLLARAYLHKGDFDLAKATLEKIILINPDVALNISKTIEAIDYMKEHPTTLEYLKKFEGDFRNNSTEMIFRRKIMNNQIYGRASNQSGFFKFPAGENILKRGTTGKGYIDELMFNEQGKVYGVKLTENFKENEYTTFGWKQDSIIWNAETLLKKGDYQAAQVAYKKAIEKHPEHYYLYEAQRHLEYLQSNSKEAVQSNFKKIAGEFGEVKIWVENDLLYYKRPGAARRILRPISDNQFTALLNYSWIYEVVEKNGKITGIQGYQYQYESKKWERYGDWYYERTTLLD